MPRRRSGLDYDTSWARREPARLARGLLLELVVRPGVRVIASPRAVGLERLERLEAPAIFVANHRSHLDTPVLVSTLPARFRHRIAVAAAADYFFSTPATSAINAFALAAIPFERVRVNRRSSEQAAAVVAEGWSLLVYPEGGRSTDGWGREFRGGAAYLALRCGVAAVPVFLEGTGRMLPKDSRRLRSGSTTVLFGVPLVPTPGEDARRFARRLEAAVSELGDEVKSGWWAAKLRAKRGETPSLRGPEASAWRRSWLSN